MRVRAVILAGGRGDRLGELTLERTKPAVPFAGKYRVIDFTLSNCVNSQIFDVMLLAQYRPHSLIEHIGDGGPWDLDRSFTGGLKIYPPYTGRGPTRWYRGTADAVWQNLSFVKRTRPDLVLVVSGDHVYAMDYRPLIAFHVEHQADATACTIRVPKGEASRFGILATGRQSRVVRFNEKPVKPRGNLANMGVYLFNIGVLERFLEEDAEQPESTHDFGRDVLPRMLAAGAKLFAFPYTGYWVDIGTLESYWQAHMDLLLSPPPMDLNNRDWLIHTRSAERPPVRIHSGAEVRDSLLTDGTVVEAGAHVERSVLSPGVRVGKGAWVFESIILTDVRIGEEARISRAIVDKFSMIGDGAQVGEILPELARGLVTIGRHSDIPAGAVIRTGAVSAA